MDPEPFGQIMKGVLEISFCDKISIYLRYQEMDLCKTYIKKSKGGKQSLKM